MTENIKKIITVGEYDLGIILKALEEYHLLELKKGKWERQFPGGYYDYTPTKASKRALSTLNYVKKQIKQQEEDLV